MFTWRSSLFGDRSHSFNYAVIALAGILCTLPALVYGFPAYNHDGWVHSLWYSQFSDQLWAGEVYPRWLLGLNQGLGSPALFYYPPLPYYFTSAFKPLFPEDMDGLRQLGASAALAVVASGWMAYLWLCRIVPRKPALVASLIYLVMPYHLTIDLYLRGAFAEVWAFVWLPLILFFAHKLGSGERFSVAGLAVGYALLIGSHLPTALIFSPAPIVYIIALADHGGKLRASVKAAMGMGLGIGLSAIYLLPALALREFVSMQEMSKPEINFENWFVLATVWGRGFPAYLSWIALSMMAVAGCAYLLARKNPTTGARRERTLWAMVTAGALFMMTPLSKPLWKLLPVLQNVQFPFRFNTLVCVAVMALMALALAGLKPAPSVWPLALQGVPAAAALVWMLVIPLSAWREYKVHPVTRASYRELISNNQDAPEYRPRWAERNAFYALQGEMRQGSQVEQARVIEGKAEGSVESWLPRKIRLRVNAGTGAVLRIRQLYFPGWRARTETGSEVLTRPSEATGLLEIVVPGDVQQLNLELTQTSAERWGKVVSIVSVLILAALMLSVFFLRPHPGPSRKESNHRKQQNGHAGMTENGRA